VDIIHNGVNVYGKPGEDLTFEVSGGIILTSGGGHDIFDVNSGFGQDTIVDFSSVQDVVRIDHNVFSDFSSVMAHTADNAQGSAVISYDTNNTITLTGVSTVNLHASNFQFV
jgi:Ca2+-binding RTX toxin-like protein